MSGSQISLLKNFKADELQSYIDKIKEIQNINLSNLTDEEKLNFNSLQVKEYATALSGVEASQAALLLSTQGLTNAQIAQILAEKEGNTQAAYEAMLNAGLLKSKQPLTNAELQKTIATKIGNEEDAKAIMASMGLSVAIEGEEAQTVQLTAKKLQQAVTSGLLTEAQANEIAMTMGVTMAQKAQIGSVMPQWIANMKAMALATWAQIKVQPFIRFNK